MKEYKILVQVVEVGHAEDNKLMWRIVFADCLTWKSAIAMMEAIDDFKTIILKKALAALIGER